MKLAPGVQIILFIAGSWLVLLFAISFLTAVFLFLFGVI